MNRLSKRILLIAASLLTPLSLGLAVASALPEQAQNHLAATSGQSNGQNEFCTNLPNLISRTNTNLTNLQDKLTSAWSQRDQAIAANDTKWDEALAADQAKWATERQTQFSDLQNKATTDAQKAAVQTFISAVTNAIQSRESANAAARNTFRTGVKNLVANQRSNISSQVSTFVAAVNTAENAATASCNAGSSQGQTIRTTFQSAMRSARETFNSGRKGDSGIGDQVKQLAATRDATIKANDAAFVKAVQAAADTLKAAFAGSGTNVSQ